MTNKTSFISSVLLDDAVFSITELADLLEKEFNFKIDRNSSFDTQNNTFVHYIDDTMITVALMPLPVANNQALDACKNSFDWDDACDIAKNHKAHVLIVVSGNVDEAIDFGVLQVLICSCALKQKHATAIFTLGTLIKPDIYISEAVKSVRNRQIPLLNMVYFGLYKKTEQITCGYTYGLYNFGKQEIEIIDSKKPIFDVFSCLTKVSSYLLSQNQTLVDGEMIGITLDEKLKVTLSKGVAVLSDTFKIEY